MRSGGYITLMIGFVALVGVTIVHAFSSEVSKIPEGGAPPFLMTLFIGGAQISLTLTVLQMIATLGGDNSEFLYINVSLTQDEKKDKLAAMRNLLVWTMLSKTYIVQFLKNSERIALNTMPRSCMSRFLTTWMNAACPQTRSGPAPPTSSRSRPPPTSPPTARARVARTAPSLGRACKRLQGARTTPTIPKTTRTSRQARRVARRHPFAGAGGWARVPEGKNRKSTQSTRIESTGARLKEHPHKTTTPLLHPY